MLFKNACRHGSKPCRERSVRFSDSGQFKVAAYITFCPASPASSKQRELPLPEPPLVWSNSCQDWGDDEAATGSSQSALRPRCWSLGRASSGAVNTVRLPCGSFARTYRDRCIACLDCSASWCSPETR